MWFYDQIWIDLIKVEKKVFNIERVESVKKYEAESKDQ